MHQSEHGHGVTLYSEEYIVHDPDCQCSKKKTMEKMIVVHKNSGADICIMVCLDKETGKYRFVNLTKRHICICQFDTIEDAMEDLDRYVKEGKIKGYTAC